jgi:ribonuclease HI
VSPVNDWYLAYADGACKGNPGPGGWGVVIIAPDGARSEFNGGERHTTNNRMEMTAAIEALRRIPERARIVLRSDSQLLIKTINHKWKRNKNRDLWDELDVELALRDVEFEWVQGHAGDLLNERADELANLGVRGEIVAEHETAAAPAAVRGAGAKLAPLLAPGETVRRCAGCGREFVSSASAEAYCSLAECQLRARRRG